MEELEDALPNDDEVSISFSMFGSGKFIEQS